MKIYARLNGLFNDNPRMEVIVRLLWHFVPKSIKARIIGGKKPPRVVFKPNGEAKTGNEVIHQDFSWDDIDLQTGDVVVLHSSGRALAASFGSVEQALSSIKDFAFCTGVTFLIPSYPILHRDAHSAGVLTWRLDSERQSTGALGAILIGDSKAKRSLCPFNNLTAVGPMAAEILATENLADMEYPCGYGSIWASLSTFNAKVVFFGTDIASALTALHIPEDGNPEFWSRYRWYEQVAYVNPLLLSPASSAIKLRRPTAAVFYAERMFDADLRKDVFSRRAHSGINIYYAHVDAVLHYLLDRRKTNATYPYFFLPILKYL